MKIIILGAGRVGATLAENLTDEDNSVTIVDTNEELLHEIQSRLDIQTVTGFASHPSVLREAGAEDADAIIAVTDADETNMVACQVAYTLFQVPTKIARIRSREYTTEKGLFSTAAIPADLRISPEKLVTNYIRRLIDYPGALEVVDFASGRIRIVGIRAAFNGPLVGQELRTLGKHLPNVETRVLAIYRRGKPMLPRGDTIVEAEDEIYFIATRRNTKKVIGELQRIKRSSRRIMIAGGGHIGARLARALEKNYRVKLIEGNDKRATELSEQLQKTTVLCGEAADENLLYEENIENIDIFCAVTNDEEVNILSAMQAKKMGAGKAMALINRPSYAHLVESIATQIDVAISPQQTTVSALLAFVRRGMKRAHTLRRGKAEAIEIVVRGKRDSSKVVGRQVDEIRLPKNRQGVPCANIGAILRNNVVHIAHHNTVIEQEDHVILFVSDKQHLPQIEQLFQPKP